MKIAKKCPLIITGKRICRKENVFSSLDGSAYYCFDTEMAPPGGNLPNERIGLVWEEDAQPEQVITMAERTFPSLKPLSELDVAGEAESPTHYIIEGDNYHALATLSMTQPGSCRCHLHRPSLQYRPIGIALY